MKRMFVLWGGFDASGTYINARSLRRLYGLDYKKQNCRRIDWYSDERAAKLIENWSKSHHVVVLRPLPFNNYSLASILNHF